VAAGSHKTSIPFLQNTGYSLVQYETLYFQSDSEVMCGIRDLISKGTSQIFNSNFSSNEKRKLDYVRSRV